MCALWPCVGGVGGGGGCVHVSVYTRGGSFMQGVGGHAYRDQYSILKG